MCIYTIHFQAKKEKAASYHLELAELANQKYEEKKQQRDQNLIEDQKVGSAECKYGRFSFHFIAS